MIKVNILLGSQLKTTWYYPADEGRLKYEYVNNDFKSLDLKWGRIEWHDLKSNTITDGNVSYTVVATKDSNARLDS